VRLPPKKGLQIVNAQLKGQTRHSYSSRSSRKGFNGSRGGHGSGREEIGRSTGGTSVASHSKPVPLNSRSHAGSDAARSPDALAAGPSISERFCMADAEAIRRAYTSPQR